MFTCGLCCNMSRSVGVAVRVDCLSYHIGDTWVCVVYCRLGHSPIFVSNILTRFRQNLLENMLLLTFLRALMKGDDGGSVESVENIVYSSFRTLSEVLCFPVLPKLTIFEVSIVSRRSRSFFCVQIKV